MTSTAEERALALVAKFERECTDDMCFADWVNGIAQAIRSAENDKLEDAARIAEACRSGERSDYGAGRDDTANEIADAIRSLKKD